MRILDWLFPGAGDGEGHHQRPDFSDWMGDDPRPMIELLPGRASERKLRLFVAACCRSIPASRLCWAYRDAGVDEYDWDKVLTMSERFADGAGSREELQVAIELAERVDDIEAWQSDRTTAATRAIAVAVALRPAYEPRQTRRAGESRSVAIEAALQVSSKAKAASADSNAYAVAGAAQAELLREIFGNPFQHVQPTKAWSTPDSNPVVRLARAIYEDRAFDGLPALAEALERQGYRDPDVLGHCRRPGGHVRGCWVVDLILGKP